MVALLGATVAVVLGVRREMWLDEYHTWLLAGMPLKSLWIFVTGDVHPPLYFLLINGWRRLTGDDALALRAPSILAYVASVLVFGTTIAQLRGPRAAAIGTLTLFGFSPALVYYGSEARMYTLTVLLACVVLWGWIRVVTREEPAAEAPRGIAPLVAGASVLLVLTHYTGVFFVAGLGLAWLVRCTFTRRGWRPFLQFAVLTALGAGLWAPTVLSQRARKGDVDRMHAAATRATAPVSGSASTVPGTATIPTAAARPGQAGGTTARVKAVVLGLASIAGVFPADQRWLLVLLAVPFLLLALGVALAVYARDPLALPMIVIVAATMAGMLVINATERRYLLVSTPAIALLLHQALVHLQRRARLLLAAGASAGLVSLVGCMRMAAAPVSRPLERISATIAESGQGVPVLLYSNYGEIPLRYHARRMGNPAVIGFPIGIEPWWAANTFKGWATVPVSRDSTERWFATRREPEAWLVVVEPGYQDPWGHVSTVVDQRYDRTEMEQEALAGTGWRLYRIRRR